MANLAGFDFIFELARSALQQELLKSPLEKGQNGEVLDTLEPPFSFKREIPLAGSTVTVDFIIEAIELLAVPRSSSLRLRFDFDKSSFVQNGLGAISMLSGQFTIDGIMLSFDSPDQKQKTNLAIRSRSRRTAATIHSGY